MPPPPSHSTRSPSRAHRARPTPVRGLLVALLLLLPAAGLVAWPAAGEKPDDEAGAAEEGPLVPEGDRPDLILIYTGRVRGFVEPCGCPRNPAGGLSRRAAYLDLLADRYPRASIVLAETGDFAADPDEPGRLKSSTYVQGLDEFGYDVVGLGERELTGGLDLFEDLFRKKGFPLISASFTLRGSAEPFVEPYVVREVALRRGRSIRIGFISLTSHNSAFASVAADGRAVVTRDPVAQARSWLPRVKAESDLVVLLANLSGREVRDVVEAVPGAIDLVLAAWSDRISPRALEEIGGVPTLYSGDQGRRLGEVRIFLDDHKVSRMIAHHIHLTRRYPEVPKYQRLIDGMLTKVNEMMKVRALAEAKSAPASAGSGGGATDEATRGDRFVGAARCLTCHDDAYRVWEHSRHAHAMQTLVGSNQDYNPECVVCHNTGFGEPNGFRSTTATPELANVQCEACHGHGSGHLRDSSATYGAVAPRTCFACHTRENSPEFSFFKYWNTIKH